MKEQEEKQQLTETWETPEINVVEINEQTNADFIGTYNDGGYFS